MDVVVKLGRSGWISVFLKVEPPGFADELMFSGMWDVSVGTRDRS